MKILAILLMIGAASITQAQENTVYGQSAAASEQSSTSEISVFGYEALYACQSCFGSTVMGFEGMRVSSGYYNTGMGYATMYNSTSGSYNTALGAFTLQNLGTGSENTAIGYDSGSCATVNGSNDIWINNCGLAKDNAVIRIGTQGTQKFTAIAGIYGVTAAGPTYEVVINAKGQLGYSKTTVQVPATQADVLALRQEIAALKNQMYALQARVH